MTIPALLHPWALLLLCALSGVYWLFLWADRRRDSDLRRFASGGADVALARRPRQVLLAALGLVALAIAQPVWHGRGDAAPGSSLDVVFLLDVSRSMLTWDRGASRIGQARAAIKEVLSHSTNERFGLVVFAGNASVECPLTHDYAFLRDQLERASRDSVTLGGTRMGDAIRFAARTVFDEASRNARELVLIGDGGDEASEPAAAAGELEKRGIRLVVVGAGDESAPGFVPNSESDPSPMLYQGKPVITRLDSASLERVCKASEKCVYATASDTAIPKIILDNRSALSRAGTGTAPVTGAVLALVAAGLLLWERTR